eukprot:899737-Amorphochlora_amoeboformis.AAC.1
MEAAVITRVPGKCSSPSHSPRRHNSRQMSVSDGGATPSEREESGGGLKVDRHRSVGTISKVSGTKRQETKGERRRIWMGEGESPVKRRAGVGLFGCIGRLCQAWGNNSGEGRGTRRDPRNVRRKRAWS